MWFQVHYPPLVGVLPTFRSRYWFAIGLQRVLSLAGWSPQIRTAFHVRGLTQDTPRPFTLTSTGLSPAMAGCSKAVRLGIEVLNGVLQPRRDMSLRFGLIRVRSPLLTESLLLSFPPGTEMFQFPGLAASTYGFSGCQFGHPGLNARLTAPPGLSQFSTPFVAAWRQGIPHTPLVA